MNFKERRTIYIEKEVAGFEGPAHNKSVLRNMKGREFDMWEREGADYTYGWDEGVIV